MTAPGDCEPSWEQLCDLGAQQLHDPLRPQPRTIETIEPDERYL